MTPVSDGFDSQPCTYTQRNKYEEMSTVLNEKGFIELPYAEMNMVISDIDLAPDGSIVSFGKQ